MKKVYKVSMAAVAAIIFSFSASSTFAQCVQITCPANITVAADTVSCGALVNYTMPVVVDTCVADADTFFFTGAMQTFTVPAGVTSVSFDVRGAQGSNGITGSGGLGARMQGAFAVTPGDVFDILVGQQGLDNHISPGHTGRSTGGGGGSFVVLASTPMIIAGGGGGTGNISPGINASTGTSGENSLGSPVGTGGAGGNGGGADAGMNGGGSGGGFTTDGGVPAGDGGTSPNRGGKAYVNGGAGGDNGQHSGGGGFGGGAGGGNYGGGGGGGYSGGGGGASNGYGGGGGGSYNTGTAQVNTAGYQTGNGMVIVSWAGSPVPVTVSSGLPSGSVFPQGTSTVTLLADNGAGGVDSCSFTVTVTGTAVANADVADTVACSTDGAISLNGTPAGGTWSGAGVTGSSFSPSAAGVGVHIVSYAYTNALGCSDTASASINVLGCGGIGETGNWQLVAYPNPAQNFTSIDFGTDYNHIEINMMDIHGKLVRTAHYENASSVKISLENISAGTYFINVKADNKNTVIKIFKD